MSVSIQLAKARLVDTLNRIFQLVIAVVIALQPANQQVLEVMRKAATGDQTIDDDSVGAHRGQGPRSR